jgi:Zn-dependent protease/CBS domain-containing protein
MKTWSIPLGRIFGVELRVHWTFLILLAYVLATESVSGGVTGAWRGMALVAIVFGSVIVHELAHALVSLRLKVAVRGIMLLPIGGVTFTDPSSDDVMRAPQKEVQIALAGPMVNLVLGLIAAAAVLALYPQSYLWARPLIDGGALPRGLVWANLFLGAFNLLPAFPMDGGRVLRGWLAQRTDFYSATRRAVTLGQVFAMAFFIGGMWYPWSLVIGLFIFFGAQLEERSLTFKSVLDSVKLEDVMLTDFSTLSPADTLEDALAKAVHTLQDDFPVIRGSDMVGVISRQRIVEALRAGGNAYVQSAMLRAYEVGERGETLASAFRKMGGRGVNLLPVVDHERLVGIVTLQNLMHSMGMVAESRRSRLFGRG